MADLITQDYAQAALNLTGTQLARLPAAVAAASRLVRNYCGRHLSARDRDLLITPPQRGAVLLPDYPIVDVARVSGDPRPVFTVTNADRVTNQRATARMIRTGDDEAGYSASGIRLERFASGTLTAIPVQFAALTPPTLASLAAAINALPGGWTATVAAGFEAWGVSELWAGQGAQGALGQRAEFRAWTADLPFRQDDARGLLYVDASVTTDDPFRSMRWGPQLDIEYGDDEIRGQFQGLRVAWTGGYATTPADLADAVAQVAKSLIEQKSTNQTVARERIDTWEIEYRAAFQALPSGVLQTLALYRDHAR